MSDNKASLNHIMDFMLWRITLTDLQDRLELKETDDDFIQGVKLIVNRRHSELNANEIGKRTMFPPEPVRLARKDIVDMLNYQLPSNAPVDINDNMSLLAAFCYLSKFLD